MYVFLVHQPPPRAQRGALCPADTLRRQWGTAHRALDILADMQLSHNACHGPQARPLVNPLVFTLGHQALLRTKPPALWRQVGKAA